MRRVYVDYAATTPIDPRVFEAMKPYFIDVYGNASSINAFGLEAKRTLEDSRRVVAVFMNAQPEELIFTGSATEANNLVLKGYAFKHGRAQTHIAISTIEHDCVLNSAKWLENLGFKVTHLPVDRKGILDLEELEKTLRKGANLVSVIHGNNEIGTIQSIKSISEICHAYGALFHTDAAQSFGKIPIDVNEAGMDFMTINAHKMYGPKGVGGLFIKDKKEVEALLHGGGHEYGIRSSTENIPGIAGFAKAVELRRSEMKPEARRLTQLRDRLIKGTLEIENVYLNGHPTQRLPNIANFIFSYIEGESLLLLLNEKGIAASTGSACSSGSQEPSHVLLAIGLKQQEAHGSLRISLGKYNTEEDIDYILEILPEAVEKLRKISPLTHNRLENNPK